MIFSLKKVFSQRQVPREMRAKLIPLRFVKQIVDGAPKMYTPPTKLWYNIERTTLSVTLNS